jgi:Cft2 family RNA processing exonuclease
MLDVRFKEGVELPEYGLWLDPRRAKTLAFVSHAHSDHLAARAEVLLTPATARLMRARVRGRREERVVPYGASAELGDARVTLLAAGHICGSAQLFLESRRGSLLYTGDFKLRASRSTETCGWQRADTLVMETTFGLPKYVLPPTEEVIQSVIAFCREALEQEVVPVLYAYSLGKAQEIVWALLEHRLVPMLGPAAFSLTEICAEMQPGFPKGFQKLDLARASGHVLVMPPGRQTKRSLESLVSKRTAVLTGWAMDPHARFRYGTDAAFALSDHADYPDLLRYVELVQPRRVLTLHGFAAAFAADLRARGVEAWALSEDDQMEFAL